MSLYTFLYDLALSTEFIKLLEVDGKEDNKDNEDKETRFLTKKKSKAYHVISYDKTILQHSLYKSLGLFRSVIVNKEGRVVSFSPPKSIVAETFISANSVIDNEKIIVEEFVEGTMINVFFDPSIGVTGTWQIATKNVVGAETAFYKGGKTFSTMFLEAAHYSNLFIELLDRGLTYSFVLQHPGNRIVVPFNNPALYLVQVYEIQQNDDATSIKVFPLDMRLVSQMDCWMATRVLFPKRYDSYTDYAIVIHTFASMNTPYQILGVVVKNMENGERCKIRNPNYEQVRLLRGNQPKLQYLYLSLRKEGKIKDYLQYYPEHKPEFSGFRDHLHLYTTTLHQNYIDCFVKKEKHVLDYPDEYRKHMNSLHRNWLNELREKKQAITKREVIDYVNSLHPSQIMYVLNYNMVRRGVDFLNAEVDDMDVVL
jgi:hypothetical protein